MEDNIINFKGIKFYNYDFAKLFTIIEEGGYLVDGIVEDIITEFSMIQSIEIISRHTAFGYKGKAIDATQIAEELGVNFIATGSIR